jgi:choline dehydrogenase-like flavoprotein
MIPFLAEDLESPIQGGSNGDDEAVTPWPVVHRDIVQQVTRLEKLFGLPASHYEDGSEIKAASTASTAGGAFILRSPKWPAFGRRNVAAVFDAVLRSADGPQIWLNATVTAMRLSAAGRIESLEIRSPSGMAFTVPVTELVVAAGAIESTRLLLQLDADHNGRLFAHRSVIGRYFHDHLSAPVAGLKVRNRARLAQLAGFRFEGSGMRNNRFELTGAARRALGLPGAFVHIGFSSDGPSGFDGLREVYRSLQRRRLPRTADLALLCRHAPWLARAAWTRFIDRRVLAPDDVRYELHVVTEQIPVATNRITLSPSERDVFGLPLAQINWRVSPQDVERSERTLQAFMTFWSARNLDEIGAIELYDPARRTAAVAGNGGIFHPGGSLRMADSATSGVVDGRLRAFDVSNLRVVSTATFPSGGSANPTMMLMLFALLAVDDLAAASI